MWLLSGWVGVTKFGSLKAKEFQRYTVLTPLCLKEQVFSINTNVCKAISLSIALLTHQHPSILDGFGDMRSFNCF
jgi:hypothetical protein